MVAKRKKSGDDALSSNPEELTRRSYLIKNKLIVAIKVMAALQNKNDYDVINELLEKSIPKKYLNLSEPEKNS